MSSIIRINGRVRAASRDYRPDLVVGHAPPSPSNVRPGIQDNGRPRTAGAPIAADSPDSYFRAGIPYEDPHEGVVYRVIEQLNIAEGWGTGPFWTRRLNCNYADVLHFVKLGLMDAALEPHSRVKRFKCRDEYRVREWLGQRERDRWTEIRAHVAQPPAPQPAPAPAAKPVFKPKRRFR